VEGLRPSRLCPTRMPLPRPAAMVYKLGQFDITSCNAMPIYEYNCTACGHHFDHLARTLRDTAKKCPKCGATKLQKGFSSFAARVPTAASKACDSCVTSPACPSAGRGRCGYGCGG